MTYHYLCPEVQMLIHILASWLASALALWIVAQIVPGIGVRGFGAALSVVLTILTYLLRRMLVPGHGGTTYL